MALAALYSAFQKAENRVGGGEGSTGIYGSMTQQGTCSIMAAMVKHADLTADSVLVDIGSGLCRPLLHAVVDNNVGQTYGIEFDTLKCQKALPFIKHTVNMMDKAGHSIPEAALPVVFCASVEEFGSLEPATHAYAAWEGFPMDAKEAIGQLFQRTDSLKAITIVQRSMRNEDPVEVMEDLGFGPVECLAAALPVYMAGSGRKLNAYLFVKTEAQTQQQPTARPGPSLLTATPYTSEQDLSEFRRGRTTTTTTTSAQGPDSPGSQPSQTSDASQPAGPSAPPPQAGRSSRSNSLSAPGRAASTDLPPALKGLSLKSPGPKTPRGGAGSSKAQGGAAGVGVGGGSNKSPTGVSKRVQRKLTLTSTTTGAPESKESKEDLAPECDQGDQKGAVVTKEGRSVTVNITNAAALVGTRRSSRTPRTTTAAGSTK